MKKFLIFFVSLLLFLLSGCGQPAPKPMEVPVSEEITADLETKATEETTAGMEDWVFEWPTGAARERTLEGFELVLPEGMTREDDSSQRASLMVDGQVVGGIFVMELNNSVMFSPGFHRDQIADYLKNTVFSEVPKDQWSHLTGGNSEHAYHEVLYGTRSGEEYINYIFRYVSFWEGKDYEEDIYYDLWFDRGCVGDETIEAIVTSVIVPSIEEET